MSAWPLDPGSSLADQGRRRSSEIRKPRVPGECSERSCASGTRPGPRVTSATHFGGLRGVVGVAGEDGDGAVDLLKEHDPGKLVRPCGRAESNRQLRLLAQAGGEPVVAAEDERDGGFVLRAPALQSPRKGRAAHALAALVQNHYDAVLGNH